MAVNFVTDRCGYALLNADDTLTKIRRLDGQTC